MRARIDPSNLIRVIPAEGLSVSLQASSIVILRGCNPVCEPDQPFSLAFARMHA
jgi:hypothetical protein